MPVGETSDMNPPPSASSSTPLERDARLVNARHGTIRPGEIAIGVIIGRTAEFFDFFVYALAAVLVFPSMVFPYVDPLTGTLYSFALFSLAFVGRPLGTLLFTAIDQRHGRGVKLTISMFLLGGSTMAIALLPSHAQVGMISAWLLGFFRLCQGIALGGAWDGLPSRSAGSSPTHTATYACSSDSSRRPAGAQMNSRHTGLLPPNGLAAADDCSAAVSAVRSTRVPPASRTPAGGPSVSDP